jgi:hypothetical protein
MQNPVSGGSTRPGTMVDLKVSKGPPPEGVVLMPAFMNPTDRNGPGLGRCSKDFAGRKRRGQFCFCAGPGDAPVSRAGHSDQRKIIAHVCGGRVLSARIRAGPTMTTNPKRSLRPRRIGPLVMAPSILSADFARLGEDVRRVEKAGADWVHVDVMDGHFVPNITVGPVVVHWLKKCTSLPQDVHLMIENPEKYIPAFAKAGAWNITVHWEACRRPAEVIRLIKKSGCQAGLSVRPRTPIQKVAPVPERFKPGVGDDRRAGVRGTVVYARHDP